MAARARRAAACCPSIAMLDGYGAAIVAGPLFGSAREGRELFRVTRILKQGFCFVPSGALLTLPSLSLLMAAI
jgi:hypothetical protein